MSYISHEEDAFEFMRVITESLLKLNIYKGSFVAESHFISAIVELINTTPYLRTCIVRKYNALKSRKVTPIETALQEALFTLLHLSKKPYDSIKDHSDLVW
jgi:hypothetical protein